MDKVFHLFDLLNDIVVDRDLLVLAGETNDQLLDSKGNGFLLVLSLPEETILSDGAEDLLGEVVKISLRVKRFDLKHDKRHCDNNLLLFLSSGIFFGLGSSFLSGFGVLLIIIAKEIEVIVVLLGRSSSGFGIGIRRLECLGAGLNLAKGLNDL